MTHSMNQNAFLSRDFQSFLLPIPFTHETQCALYVLICVPFFHGFVSSILKYTVPSLYRYVPFCIFKVHSIHLKNDLKKIISKPWLLIPCLIFQKNPPDKNDDENTITNTSTRHGTTTPRTRRATIIGRIHSTHQVLHP